MDVKQKLLDSLVTCPFCNSLLDKGERIIDCLNEASHETCYVWASLNDNCNITRIFMKYNSLEFMWHFPNNQTIIYQINNDDGFKCIKVIDELIYFKFNLDSIKEKFGIYSIFI